MLLQISTTHYPATDLGFLLGKNPARAQSFDLAFGKAQVFYPEASAEKCSVALLVEVDPVRLVRRAPGAGGALDQYVNDRPYAASSFLSVALASVFGTALGGRCRDRPELAETKLPLQAMISAVPCRGGGEFLHRLFEPLGYRLTAGRLPLDETRPDWGDSVYFHITLQGTVTLRMLLSHLYVLLPVLDNDKHYWIGDDEVEKLVRHGGDWLASHPLRETIALRYLKHRRSLASDALAQLSEGHTTEPEDSPEIPEAEPAVEPAAAIPERALPLNEQRLAAVLSELKASGAARVLDLGCGEGRLLQLLMREKQFTSITGIDVSTRTLEIARNRLHLDRLVPGRQERLQLLQGSLIYRDDRLAGADAAAVVEVIEHLDPPRLAAFGRVVFECARPGTVVITTPNREYNVMWETLPAGKFRHRDHRFEWTRAEFQDWACGIAGQFGYDVRFLPVGPEDESVGPPTQMAVFSKSGMAG